MNKSHSIKLRLSINLTQDDLGFTRLYDELKGIECNTTLTVDEISAAKRRHLLVILFQYSLGSISTFPSSMSVPAIVSTSSLAMTMVDPKVPIPHTPTFVSSIEAIAAQPTIIDETPDDAMRVASKQALNDIGASFADANPTS